jgi:adenylate kinase
MHELFFLWFIVLVNVVSTGSATLQMKNLHIMHRFDQNNAKLDTFSLQNPLKVIIDGPPAAGKGTQCRLLQSKYKIIHLSSGDILRKAVADKSSTGLKVQKYMNNGLLVPDELITELVFSRLQDKDCVENGWLLDGFPRTPYQADRLQATGLSADCFITLDVDERLLIERVLGRRVDPLTGQIYHLQHLPPLSEEVARRLIRRTDDTEEKVATRVRDYRRHMDSIRSRFSSITLSVDGERSHGQIHQQICAEIDDILRRKGRDSLNRPCGS